MGLIDRVMHRLYALCGVLAGAAIVLIAILVLINVVSRLFGAYVGGMTEGAGYAMAAAGSLGLAYTFGTGGHIRVDLLLGAVRGKARRRMDRIAFVATTATLLFLSWYLARMVLISWRFGDLSDGSDELPLWLPQLPVAFGFSVFALSLVHGTVIYLATGESPIRDSDAVLPAAEKD